MGCLQGSPAATCDLVALNSKKNSSTAKRCNAGVGRTKVSRENSLEVLKRARETFEHSRGSTRFRNARENQSAQKSALWWTRHGSKRNTALGPRQSLLLVLVAKQPQRQQCARSTKSSV
ncbi:hypothetical protein NDU88_002991 [Pleurodeles waltl]|uniref:Uncharacterized protein n=1 Tax=Pleurodeles waltl TaxID=8319 RepID=A0AAV7PBP5_PLEWA|nr:hypothetical protein NDU88_002991 [Pleurodeles waltl]